MNEAGSATRDAKDSFLLALAASEAAFLVSGDKGLHCELNSSIM